MTAPESEANRAVAEIAGWVDIYGSGKMVNFAWAPGHFSQVQAHWQNGDVLAIELPDYYNDLPAIRALVLTLSPTPFFVEKDGMNWTERCEYMRQLENIVVRDTGTVECQFDIINATAKQCVEAFLGAKAYMKARMEA